jgi:long-chain acyl-CoA synthetase
MNVAEYLLKAHDSGSDFLIAGGRTISYGAFREAASAVAAYLKERHGSGKHIVLRSDDGFYFAVAYLAILMSGNTAVLVETMGDEREFKHIRDLAKPVAFFDSGRRNLRIKNAVDDSDLDSIIEKYRGKKTLVARKDADVAHIIFTSGSTGEKKGVMITHGNIRANTESILSYLHLTKKDRAAVVLPLFYSYGLSLLHTHLRAGGSLLFSRGRFLGGVLDDIEQFKCTGLAGVPSTFEFLIKHADFLKRRLPSLRYMTQAGGKMADETILKVSEAFPRILLYIMYGATEATTRLSYLPPEFLRSKLGSIGKGMNGVKLSILDESGSALERGEIGELCARGANIMKGYLGDTKSTRETIRNGWLRTGDLAVVDRDGFIFIVGRKKHMIKSAGYRFSPYEVEAALRKDVDIVAVGVPDALLGEAVALLVEGPASDAARESIFARAAKVLPSYKAPKQIFFVDSLPRTASGKIDMAESQRFVLQKVGQTEKPLDALLRTPQYHLKWKEKASNLLPVVQEQLSNAKMNPAIKNWFGKKDFMPEQLSTIEQIPYVPVQMFKHVDLSIKPKKEIARVVTSSGTTSAQKSQVPLDKKTTFNQTRALAATLSTVLGRARRPFIVIDHKGINAAADSVSARTIGVRGLSAFARSTEYLLEERGGSLRVNGRLLRSLIKNGIPETGYSFGFTYIIWSALIKELQERNVKLPKSSAHLFHSGGWKKLTDARVSKADFNRTAASHLGLREEHIHEFYGMAEEGGVLFIDCEVGHKHAPDCAAVIVRDFHTLQPVQKGGIGLIEVVSALPESYYGQAVLTEDIGRLLGVDDCPCGKKGEYFEFISRVPHAEMRGCGDTFREL